MTHEIDWNQVAIDALDRARQNSGQMTPEEERDAFDRLWSEETRLAHSSLGSRHRIEQAIRDSKRRAGWPS